MNINYQKRIFGLDIVRAIAILLVLLSHCVLIIAPNNSGLIATVFRLGGALGVDIFFVLSGFLIGGILIKYLDDDSFSFRNLSYFWVRRWFRTLPNYFLILIVNIVLGYFILKNIPNDIFNYFLFFQNFNFPQPDFFTESWSLSIEEFSYILGPLLIYLLLLIKSKKKHVFLISTLTVILIGITSKLIFYFNTTITDYQFWTNNLRKVVIYRIDCVYYGFLAIYLFKRFNQKIEKSATTFFIVGLLFLVIIHLFIYIGGFTVVNSPLFFNVFYLPLISISLGIMLWKMAIINSANKMILKPITFISIISYSIYLINYSIILLLLKKFIPAPETLLLKVIILIVFLSLTFIFSYLLYRFYEKPSMNLRDHPSVTNFIKK